MNTRLAFASTALAFLLTGLVSAQGITRIDGFVGWAPGTPGRIDVLVRCQKVKTCTGALGAATSIHAGGTAYDARHQAAWVSDGSTVELRSLVTCQALCKFTHTPTLQGAVVTGLAMHERTQTLWVLDARPSDLGLTAYDVSGVPEVCAKVRTRCTAPAYGIQGGMATGLALDDARGFLFMAITRRLQSGQIQNFLAVASTANPCRFCKWPVPVQSTCPLRLAQGLAYDPCKDEVHLTDGVTKMAFQVGDPRRCAFRYVRCCTVPGVLRGLARVPGWVLTSKGSRCFAKPCTPCEQMNATTHGDPLIGNPAFRIDLEKAPAAQLSVLFVKFGPCSPALKVLCGEVYPYPANLILANPILGTGCDGSVQQPLPLPLNRQLCGFQLCAQFMIVCPATTAPGTGLSNAIEFRIR